MTSAPSSPARSVCGANVSTVTWPSSHLFRCRQTRTGVVSSYERHLVALAKMAEVIPVLRVRAGHGLGRWPSCVLPLAGGLR